MTTFILILWLTGPGGGAYTLTDTIYGWDVDETRKACQNAGRSMYVRRNPKVEVTWACVRKGEGPAL